MAGPTPRSLRAVPAPSSPDTVGAIVGEFLAEKKRSTIETAAIEAQRAKGRRPVFVIVLAVLCAVLWVTPSLMREAPSPLGPEHIEAGARMTLFLASERIRAYRREHGKLPATLADAGVDSTGIAFRPATGDAFALGTEVNGTRLEYESTMNTAAFLGSTLQILGRP